MHAELCFRAAAAGDLVRVELDALTAIYDRRSGQTHLLASPLPEMLEALGDGEWTLAQFVDHLATMFELSSAPALRLAGKPAAQDKLPPFRRQAGALADSNVDDGQSSGLRRSADKSGAEVGDLVAAHLGELAALGLVEAR